MSFDPSALAEPPRRDPGPPRRPEAGPGDQRPRRPDLRHDVLRVRRRRARRAPVRAPGVREHLHPDHEPDQRRVRGAGRRARGRRRGPRASRPARRPRRCRSSTSPARATTSSRSSSLYGGTYNLFHYTLPKLGITVKFVDGLDPASFGPAIDERTKAVFLETIGNPRLDVHDIRAIADVAHAKGVPVLVDNTFAPLLTKPIEHGADIVIHSATKWIGGHGTAIGGVVVDGGNFDWAASGRFPEFTQPGPVVPRRRLQRGVRQPRVHPQAARPVAARRRRRAQPVQRVPVPPGPRDAPAADRAPQPERAGDRPLAGGPARGRVGQLPGPQVASGPRRRRALPQGRLRRRRDVRRQGRRGGRPAADRQRQDLQPAGERRRREEPDHPSGQHDPPAAHAPRSRPRRA